MIDFLAVIQPFGAYETIAETSFRYLEKHLSHELITQAFSFEQAEVLTVGKKASEYIFQSADVNVLLHGRCYRCLAEADIAHTGSLSPKQIADLYLSVGEGCVPGLKGSFIILVEDRKRQCVKLFTDQLNLKPLYHIAVGDCLYVSTSLAALDNHLKTKGHRLAIDQRALLDFYLFDLILDERTFLEGVREMPAGSSLKWEQGKTVLQKYFEPFHYFDLEGPSLGEKQGAEAIEYTLRENITQYNGGPEHTAVALTGGFDSRAILALLGEDAPDYAFFSYGRAGSWDISIPQRIANKLSLNYTPFYLDDTYRQVFPEYALMAVTLSDGWAELSHANIAYAYHRHLGEYDSILTGLFGSELVKTPSSRGTFLNQHMVELLNAADPVAALSLIMQRMQESRLFPFKKETQEELLELVRKHPYISNSLPLNQKYFHYLLMVGMRKYFRKEISIQRPWKENLHPFLDIDFISTLVKTPFPWVHNFSTEKSLLRNLGIHRMYARLIHANPALSWIISTHGYRPGYLLQKMGWPVLAYDYWVYKKKISKASGLEFQSRFATGLIDRAIGGDSADGPFGQFIRSLRMVSAKQYLKFGSLQLYLDHQGLDTSACLLPSPNYKSLAHQ